MSDKSLPNIARKFIQTPRGTYCKSQVGQFHAWLWRRHKRIEDVTPEIVTEHLESKLKSIQIKTARVYKCQLLTYLDYLYSQKTILFDPEELRIRPTPKPLPEQVQSFLKTRAKVYGESSFRQFHNWLDVQKQTLQEISLEQVREYLDQRANKLSSPSVFVDRNQLLLYLEFLQSRNQIKFDPEPLRLKADPNPLPELAQKFLQSSKGHYSKTIVKKFHKWLQEQDEKSLEISQDAVKGFLNYRSKVITPAAWIVGRNQLFTYLDFLFSLHAIKFNPCILRPKPKEDALPEQARFFLSHYSAMIKKSTTQHYTSALRRFYAWLKSADFLLEELEPIHLENFAKWMLEKNLHAATRNGTLVCLRVYFRWLNEHKIISNDADALVKAKIFPKLPRYLPRPFPPKADHIMQQRLSNSQSLYHDGLLLMRRTGVRIGELINLEFDCIQHSHDQNFYLKVPLGKLNNERLVPLDDSTLRLIEKLRMGRDSSSKFLLETSKGRKTRADLYSKVLKEISAGLDIQGAINTHRLRHTFATSMLNGGMSLVGLMKILGHHDHRMTLRYSAITTETVKDEYESALKKLANRYKDIYLPDKSQNSESPQKKIKDIIKWLQKNTKPAGLSSDKKVASMIKRLRLIETELGILKNAQKQI